MHIDLPPPAYEYVIQAAERKPRGLMVFCLRNDHPACRTAKTAVITDAQLHHVEAVNRAVNRAILYRPEIGDTWSSGVRAGDCEDYALTKMQRLHALGIPRGAMRIMVTRTQRGEGHAVLLVNTRKGWLVLDNITDTVTPLRRSKYRSIWQG